MDSSSELLMETYQLTKLIGTGRFGTIRQARHIGTGEIVVIKELNRNSRISTMSMIHEINVMKECQHPHIITYYDSHLHQGIYYIVMEYARYGDLFTLIEDHRLTVEQEKKIICQIISALEYCHGHLIAHRDLKLENILICSLDRLIVKLADFGLAIKVSTDELNYHFCGTPEYVAPEIVCRTGYNPLKTDIWSMGVLIYGILYNSYPWDEYRHFEDIKKCRYANSHIKDPLLIKLFASIFAPADLRIGLREIKQNEWLAEYVISSYLPLRDVVNQVDTKVVESIKFLGFKEDDIISALHHKDDNSIERSIYYQLAGI